MKIGDSVAYKEGTQGRVLRDGSGFNYKSAIVVSLDPFILVSIEGDMMWRATVKKDDFEVVMNTPANNVYLKVIERLTSEMLKAQDEAAKQQDTYMPG